MPFQCLTRTDSCDTVYRIYAVYGQNQHVRYLTAVLVVMVVVNTGSVNVLTMPCDRCIARVATAEFSRSLTFYEMKCQYHNGVATFMFQRVAIGSALAQLLAAEYDIVTAADGRVDIGYRCLFDLQIQAVSDTVVAACVFYCLRIETGGVIIFATP